MADKMVRNVAEKSWGVLKAEATIKGKSIAEMLDIALCDRYRDGIPDVDFSIQTTISSGNSHNVSPQGNPQQRQEQQYEEQQQQTQLEQDIQTYCIDFFGWDGIPWWDITAEFMGSQLKEWVNSSDPTMKNKAELWIRAQTAWRTTLRIDPDSEVRTPWWYYEKHPDRKGLTTYQEVKESAMKTPPKNRKG